MLDKKGTLLSKKQCVQKTSINLAPLQYESPLHAIPHEWKRLIYDNSNLNKDYLIFMDCKIHIEKIMRRISVTSAKDIYWHLLSDITTRPTSEDKWREKTDLDLSEEEWATIYTVNNDLT